MALVPTDWPAVVLIRNTGGLLKKLSTSRTPALEFRSTATPLPVPTVVASPQLLYGAGNWGVPYPDPETPVQVRVTCPSAPLPPLFDSPSPPPRPPPGPMTGDTPAVAAEVA